MERCGARFWIAILLLLSVVCSSDAVEGGASSDPKEATNSTSKNESVGDVKLAPPATEKKVKEEAKERTEKDEPTETLVKKKEKPLEEAEPQGKNEKGSVNGDSHVEECDPSNRCVDDKSKIVACLRVPGEDLLDLSLLIQNKGKGPLDVNIIAPDFVTLEKKTVQLKAKENKEVKVSVKDGGNDAVIVLKAGEGSCSLNFHNTLSDSTKKIEASALPGYFSQLSVRACIVIVLAAALLVGLAWSCIRLWRMKLQGGAKYQQIDAGLPISTGGKKGAGEADGWDNSWGEDWDDEEAPMTPSKPVLTPSSKGLASRKFNKESWKD